MAIERTFALIKTGAFDRCAGPAICRRARVEGFVISQMAVVGTRFHERGAKFFEKLYKDHVGRTYFDDLMASVTPFSMAMVLERENAVAAWRALMGPTNPVKARETAPNSLRALFGGPLGAPMADNATHGSISVAEAEQEIAIFFPVFSRPGLSQIL
jgi:nucleoside diphosphate kinase